MGSASELAASQRGYLLLHRFYSGADSWDAARAMWRQGVRYVIVEHQTSLDAPTLEEFSNAPDAARADAGGAAAARHLLLSEQSRRPARP